MRLACETLSVSLAFTVRSDAQPKVVKSELGRKLNVNGNASRDQICVFSSMYYYRTIMNRTYLKLCAT